MPEERPYEFSATLDGQWLGVVISVSANECGPWHAAGCDSARITARLTKVIRGLTGVIRAARIGNEHSSMHLLMFFSEELTTPRCLTEKIDELVAGMFEHVCG